MFNNNSHIKFPKHLEEEEEGGERERESVWINEFVSESQYACMLHSSIKLHGVIGF